MWWPPQELELQNYESINYETVFTVLKFSRYPRNIDQIHFIIHIFERMVKLNEESLKKWVKSISKCFVRVKCKSALFFFLLETHRAVGRSVWLYNDHGEIWRSTLKYIKLGQGSERRTNRRTIPRHKFFFHIYKQFRFYFKYLFKKIWIQNRNLVFYINSLSISLRNFYINFISYTEGRFELIDWSGSTSECSSLWTRLRSYQFFQMTCKTLFFFVRTTCNKMLYMYKFFNKKLKELWA